MKNPVNFLVFLGCPGSGKTHFCHALMNDIKKSEKVIYKRMWSESQFVSKVKESFDQSGTAEQAIEFLCDDDLIIFDDMGSTGFVANSDWKRTIILQFIDNRYTRKKPTVITSNFSEREIKEKLGERTHSRIFDKENTILSFGAVDWRRQEGV